MTEKDACPQSQYHRLAKPDAIKIQQIPYYSTLTMCAVAMFKVDFHIQSIEMSSSTLMYNASANLERAPESSEAKCFGLQNCLICLREKPV